MCDSSDNHEGCNWDGNDCCEITCVGSLCGSRGYDCKNPNATQQAIATLQQLREDARATEAEPMEAVPIAAAKTITTQRPAIQQQAGDVTVFNGQLTLKLQGGGADMNWDLVASATSDAMKVTLGIDVNILSVNQVARRLSANTGLERTVLIHFTARSSAVDASRLRAPINQMLDDAGLGITVTSVFLSWCDGSACRTYNGTSEKSNPEIDPLIIALLVSGVAFFLLFCSGAAILYKRMLRSSGKHAQTETRDHVAHDEETAVKDSTSTNEKVDPEVASNSTMEPPSEVSDQISDTNQ